jgi:hypothetical protein
MGYKTLVPTPNVALEVARHVAVSRFFLSVLFYNLVAPGDREVALFGNLVALFEREVAGFGKKVAPGDRGVQFF